MKCFSILFEWLPLLVESIYFYYIVSHCLFIKYSSYIKYSCIILHFIFVLIRSLFIANIALALTFILISEIIIVFFYTTNSFSQKIFWGSIPTLVGIFSENLMFLTCKYFIGYDINNLLTHSIARHWGMLVYLLLFGILSFLIVHIKNRSLLLPVPLLFIYVIIVLLGIYAGDRIISIIINPNAHIDVETTNTLSLIGFAFFIILLLFLCLIAFTGKLYRKNLDLAEINRQRLLEQNQFKVLSNTNEFLRTWKHEFVNHLLTISQMLHTGNPTEALTYLNRLLKDIQYSKKTFCTGNGAVDAILSIKLMEMEISGIDFQHEIYLPEASHIPIDDIHFSALLGNMLDNAVEACKQLHGSADIKLTMKPIKSTLLIELENSSPGNYQYDTNHRLISTKINPPSGIGIKRITNIVKEAGGFYEIRPEIDRFTLSIVLPLKEQRPSYEH